MNARRLAAVVLLAGLGLLFALRVVWVAGHLGALRPVAGGERAPDFRLPLLQGGEFKLAAPATDQAPVTVIDFWATWCGPCRQELPHLDALWRRRRDVRVVAVNVEDAESLAQVKRFVAEANLGLPIALGGGAVAGDYHVTTLPHLVVVDRAGTIRRVLLGVQDDAALEAFVVEAGRPSG